MATCLRPCCCCRAWAGCVSCRCWCGRFARRRCWRRWALYHHWRTLASDSGHAGLGLRAVGRPVSLCRAGVAWDRAPVPICRALLQRLAAGDPDCPLRLHRGLWPGQLAGAASGWTASHYPALPYDRSSLPLVAVAIALAAQMTADRFLAAARRKPWCLSSLCPAPFCYRCSRAGGAGCRATVSGSLPWRRAGLAAADHWHQCFVSRWRRARPTGGGVANSPPALMLVPLVVLPALALAMRVLAQYGWTATASIARGGV